MELNFERFSFAILRGCILEEFAAVIKKRRKNYFDSGIAIMKNENLDITRYFDPPQENHLEKFSFWSNPNYPNCVFFTSNFDDVYGAFCDNMRKELKCELIKCRISTNLSAEFYPMNLFQYTSPTGKERVILSYFENSWVFYDKGESLPIENIEYYKKRQKKDRMNSQIISEYLRKMGVILEKIDTEVSQCMTFERIRWN